MSSFRSATRDQLVEDARRDKISYEKKFVVFFDILGWRNKIAAAGEDAKAVARLHNILALFRMLADQKEDSDRARSRMTTFSDNVVISHSLERQRSLVFLVGMIQVCAAMERYLVRGGLTAGSIVHNEKVVFGPALNRAYELESRVAVFPRIVVDAACVSRFKDHSFIVQEDGVYFFDFFTPEFSRLLMQTARHLKRENPRMIDAPWPELRDAWDSHPLADVMPWLKQEIRKPMNEPEWRKVSWLYDRIAPKFGEPAPAKLYRRTVLHR